MDFKGIDAQWAWLTLGLLLAALEMLVPGVYLIWIAVAALLTGVLTLLFDFSLPLQALQFVFIALIAVFSARHILRDTAIESADPLMNQRGARMIGQQAQVVSAIAHGEGRVRLGDSEWIAHGPEAAVGDFVRVTGTDGAILMVEPVALLPEGAAPTS
jgi:membrane protein implicated in regulation of membrane protease activity